MNSKKVAETIQQTREWARAEYKEKTKGLIFTKDFQTRQEALMRDPLATVGERVMAWILRRSWGEFVLYAIKDDGEAAHQRDCVRELGLDKTSVSHAVSYFKARGYLDNQGKLLYPIISPILVTPDPKKQKVAEYATFLADWKVAHSTDNQKWEDARSTNEFFRKLVRSEYKKSRKQAQKITAPGGASLLEKSSKTVQRISETEESSSSAVASVSLVVQAEEEDARSLYERFKARYPAKRFNEGKSKPSFEGRTLTQQAHILERLEVYLSCPHWKNEGGQYIPFAAKWLEECDADPQPAFSIKNEQAKKGFAESVKEEAQRRLDKFGEDLMLDLDTVLNLLGDLTLLKFFPSEPAARLALAKLVASMASTHEQVEWLVARTMSLRNEWPGPLVLRQIFCSKFKPADGIEAGATEMFPDGVPSERPMQAPVTPALPPGEWQKKIYELAAAKSLDVVPYTSPADSSHLEELRRARLRREHREIFEAMGLKGVTQEDIDRAVEEARAKRRSET